MHGEGEESKRLKQKKNRVNDFVTNYSAILSKVRSTHESVFSLAALKVSCVLCWAVPAAKFSVSLASWPQVPADIASHNANNKNKNTPLFPIFTTQYFLGYRECEKPSWDLRKLTSTDVWDHEIFERLIISLWVWGVCIYAPLTAKRLLLLLLWKIGEMFGLRTGFSTWRLSGQRGSYSDRYRRRPYLPSLHVLLGQCGGRTSRALIVICLVIWR